jgi:FSR family fosmidomycin resistance protein-like MFS transporter
LATDATRSDALGEPPVDDGRRAVAVANGAHVLHDGLSDLLYVFFPVWQAALGLDYAAVGALKACYSGGMAAFQLAATRLAGRVGHAAVLAAGTVLAGLGFVAAAYAGGFAALAVALLIAGAGASVQHPLASDIVARMAPRARRRQALGLYNTAGDLGKVVFPALATGGLLVLPAAAVLDVIGAVAIGMGLLILAALPTLAPVSASAANAEPVRAAAPLPRSSVFRQPGFAALFGVGMIDTASRAGFLTFFPLALAAKGATIGTIGLALTLVFVGGAVGKFVCGPMGARFGVLLTVAVTEGATAAGALAAPFAPLWLALTLAPLIGIGLNGTSTVLYGTVPELVPEAARARAFGVFYTGTIGAGAVTPIVLGLVSDLVALEAAMAGLAAFVLIAPVLTLRLRAPLAALAGSTSRPGHARMAP